jgi:DNA mismatch repair protein MutS
MMKQYLEMKRELPKDVFLFFRLGDFYELFFEDAKEVAQILNLTLTKRQAIPMCGVPHHSAQNYINRLIKAGKKVAIAEQTSEPVPGKLVNREISQIISSGTVQDSGLLQPQLSNYIACLLQHKKNIGLAYLELTTGEFEVAEFIDSSELMDELQRISPSELLYDESQQDWVKSLQPRAALTPIESYLFLFEQAEYTLTDHFKVHSLDGFGCKDLNAAVMAAGALIQYLKFQMRRSLDHVKSLRQIEVTQGLMLDSSTQQHLELLSSLNGKENTLLSVLDHTLTPMGARKLRSWISHPLCDINILQARLDFIEHHLNHPSETELLRSQLHEIRDIERLLSRLSGSSGNARDLQALLLSLLQIPLLQQTFIPLWALPSSALASKLAHAIHSQWSDFSALAQPLLDCLAENPPLSTKDGGLFRQGWNTELDELRNASTLGKQWIADLQNSEIERTGIKSLKIKYNAVFGYFIEVTASNLSLVPPHYVRKQTIANGERYITDELKQMENKILGAEEKSKSLELHLFQQCRSQLLTELERIQHAARAIAVLDVLLSLTWVSKQQQYCKPTLNDSMDILIVDGKHPVLEQKMSAKSFVPNDINLNDRDHLLLLITGPNMAGKSTYLRQVALLTIMAQVGSFIPAKSASIGIVDRIFTRIGASDDLSRGQSTFMVEMNETAQIIHHATERSLILLDEIGRGTATFDGLSIAWSVVEHLHDQVGARTLFATHYHELTVLADSRPSVKNFHVSVKEWNQQIIFLHKIMPGSATKSYGIQVAKLAGLPESIIDRANEILLSLEDGSSHLPVKPERTERKKATSRKNTRSNLTADNQLELNLFD